MPQSELRSQGIDNIRELCSQIDSSLVFSTGIESTILLSPTPSRPMPQINIESLLYSPLNLFYRAHSYKLELIARGEIPVLTIETFSK